MRIILNLMKFIEGLGNYEELIIINKLRRREKNNEVLKGSYYKGKKIKNYFN